MNDLFDNMRNIANITVALFLESLKPVVQAMVDMFDLMLSSIPILDGDVDVE